MTERKQLEQAIAALKAQRDILGDAVVDPSIAALRKQLAELEEHQLVEQQRKQATILFADVSGFTPMSETMDAEEVTDIMNALWQRIDAAIVAHGGMIDKHIGDGVMALWGVKETREDDPERAIRAALAMQVELAAFREERDLQLAMRVGLNTGPVLLGEVRPGEFTAMGDTVNLASRMEPAAPVGGILISHDTYRHVRGIFSVLPQEPITVKGKTKPVRTYVVQRAEPRAFRMATRGVEGIKTHMVGRDVELLALQNIFRDVMEDAETRVVTVVGEAGVGKSRLLYEFDNWIELLPEQIYYFKGRAAPEMQHIPYSLIRDMFAFRFDIRESDSAATVLFKFRAGMADVLDANRADLVGHLIGFDFSASTAVQNLLGSGSFGQMARAYLTNYVQAVASQPTVIFLEDVHWADDSSLDLIDHLVTAIPDAQLLVVCLARPPFFERRPNWGDPATALRAGGREAHTRLDLKPLSRRASRALVGEILQKVEDISDDLRDLVVDGAEGNPFYVEELIKMLLDDQVIVRGEERWRVELSRLAEVRVPSTLTGVLQARLDSLPAEEKTLLQRASVVGRLFWDATVAELAVDEADRFGKDEVVPLLGTVRDRELIFRRERSAFEGADEYIFKHALLRDVTYETVLLKLRRIYHKQVAQWLEANAGERLGEYLSLIAGHYELAGETAKAAEYLRRSGEELEKVSAFYDAMGTFERALALLPEGDVAGRAHLLAWLGSLHLEVSISAVAMPYIEEALMLSRKAGIPKTEAFALGKLSDVAYAQGRYDEAERHLGRAMDIAREINDPYSIVNNLMRLGRMAASQHGDVEKVERYAKEGLALAKEIGNQKGIAGMHWLLAIAASLRGEYGEHKRYIEESLAIHREIGNREDVAHSLNTLGEGARQQGKYAEAVRYYEEALAIYREVGIPSAFALNNLGHAYIGLDKDNVAWEYLSKALKEYLASGRIYESLESLVGMAWLWTKTGQQVRAAELLGLVLGHPALDADTKQYARPVLTMVREALPADELEAALERGKALDLETVMAEILEEEE